MSEWKRVKLGEVTKMNLKTLSSKNKLDFINYLDTGNITNNKIDNIQKLYINKDKIPSRAKRMISSNDIIYSNVRPNQKHFGFINNPLENMIVSTGFTTITIDNKVANALFIYYYISQDMIITGLQSIAEQSVSTYPSIKPSDLENLEINLPPLSEQHRIASILGSLDDKIELNNRINKNLEEQASALFRRWFVDFEFPDPDNEGKPYRSSGGKFIDSELGEIPEGWTIGSLDEYIELDPREKIIKSMEYLFFDMKCLSNVDCSISNGIYRNNTSGSSFRNFDTLVAKITPCLENGKTGFVMALSKDQIGRGSTEFIVLRSKGIISPYWIYFLSRSNEFRTKAIKSMTGSSGRQRVQYSELRMIQITFYIDLINKFDLLMQSLFLQIKKNNQENNILIAIRDSLLPKLMNNEIKL